MGFNNFVNVKAVAPEFTAQIQQKPLTGIWIATVTYTATGRTQTFTFATESAMRSELGKYAEYAVKYIREISELRDAGVAQAKEAMLKTAPRKYDKVPKQLQQPEPEQSPLQRAGYTEEESNAITFACYSTAAQLRSEWYFDCDINKEAVSRYLRDNHLTGNAENFGRCIDELYAHNHLVRTVRRRMDPPVTPYISPAARETVSEETRAKALSFDELRLMEKQRQAKVRQRRYAAGHNPVLAQ